MKTLILDYSKWRSGLDATKRSCKTGRGPTYLRNEQGYMCCLGQFSLQLAPKLTKKDLTRVSMPSELAIPIPLFLHRSEENTNNSLATEAATINDDMSITVEDKIVSLKKLFLAAGFKIRVINRPK